MRVHVLKCAHVHTRAHAHLHLYLYLCIPKHIYTHVCNTMENTYVHKRIQSIYVDIYKKHHTTLYVSQSKYRHIDMDAGDRSPALKQSLVDMSYSDCNTNTQRHTHTYTYTCTFTYIGNI